MKRTFASKLISAAIMFIVANQSLIAQEVVKTVLEQCDQHETIDYDSLKSQKSLREDQYSVGFMPGATISYRLKPKYSYSLFSTFKFQRKGSALAFWLTGSFDHYYMKTNERPLTYTPKSDTSYIHHWNIALYNFHIGRDYFVVNNNKSRFFFRFGLNAGGYIHRSRISRHYDNKQDNKIIKETYADIGQPIGRLNLGIGLGLGYEYYTTNKQSISFTPSLFIRSGGYYGLYFISTGVNIAYHFGLGKAYNHGPNID